MKPLMKVGVIFDRFLGALMFVVCAIFTFAMLLVCVDVVLRYVLNRPILWATEVCEYILVGIVTLGMAWLLKEEGHVKIDLLVDWFGPNPQALINAITSIFGALVVLTITWYGLDKTFELMQGFAMETGVLGIHKAYLLLPLDLGLFLLFVQLVRRSNAYLRSWRKGGG